MTLDRHQRFRRDPDRARVEQADPRLVVGRGHQAGDDQLPHAQARARRPLLRAHLRSDQGLGVLLRQVQARPLQGHHLRALRRRGDAPEGAPRAHGSHRPGRAGLAHLVLQGRPEPHRLPARHRSARAREGPLLRRLDRHGASTTRRARRTSTDLEDKVRGRVRADLRRPRRGSSPRSRSGSRAGATTSPRARTRTSTRTTTSGPAGSRTGPRSRCCRRSRRRASSPAASSPSSRSTITTEDAQEDPRARPQTPRSATTASSPPRELEPVATAAEQIRERARAAARRARRRRPARRRARSRSTSTSVLDALLDGRRARRATTPSSSRRVDAKNLEKARELGNGLLARRARRRPTDGDAEEVRELANDLCLRTDGKIQKDDLDASASGRSRCARCTWTSSRAARTRARRPSTRVDRLERDLAALPRARAEAWSSTTSSSSASSRTASARRTASASTSAAAWARRRSATCSRDLDLERGVAHAARDDQDVEGPEAAARDQAAQGRRRRSSSPRTSPSG